VKAQSLLLVSLGPAEGDEFSCGRDLHVIALRRQSCMVQVEGPIGRSYPMLASILFSLVVIGLMFWCGLVTANFAAERGRSKRLWFVWGALFFPLFPAQWFVLGLLPKKVSPSARGLV
jgi:hypothetical protein